MGKYGTNMDSPLKAIKKPLNAPEWGNFEVNKYGQKLDKYIILR